MLGMVLIIAGAVMVFVDLHKYQKQLWAQDTEYRYSILLMVPIFSFVGFVFRVPQLYAFALWLFYISFPLLVVSANTGRVTKYYSETKLKFAAEVMIMIGMLLGLAPMLKGLKVAKHALIALLACGVLWLISGIIYAAKYRNSAYATPPLILVLMVVLATFKRSVSISLAIAFICLNIVFNNMSIIISGFQGNETPQAIAELLNFIAAVLWVLWVTLDFSQVQLPDNLAHKSGEGWRKIN
jgi:hypothetical protein